VSGEDQIIVISPVPNNADGKPVVYGNASDVYARHGYCPGVEYVDRHIRSTGLSAVFVGIPIATAGTIGREDTSGNTGTSVTTVTAGSGGVLHEHDGKLVALNSGTVGTDQILLGLSLDGGKSQKTIRLGTGTSYVIPYFNATIGATVGTVVEGDVLHTWHGSGPRGDSTGWSLAFTELAAAQYLDRSMLLCGDIQSAAEASALQVLLAAYETGSNRVTTMRASVRDRLPAAELSSTVRSMSAANVTFAEVGATGDTITRASGSFATDGFATGDLLTISGSTSNDGTLSAAATVTSPTVITLDTDDLVDEGPVAGVTITAEASLTFSDAADTIVRAGGSPGSWLTDGFRVGGTAVVSGTVSNDGSYVITAVTADTVTFESGDLADEVIGATAVSITAGETKPAWASDIISEFAAVDDDPRIDLSAGKGRKFSSYTSWHLREPAAWAASAREYQHDLHVPCWRVSDGPTGHSLVDADGSLVEWDERADGGALIAARFTTFRTHDNRAGVYMAGSLTRALDDSLLVQTHNTMVVNRARMVCNAATQAKIGAVLERTSDGLASLAARAEVESFVNASLEKDMLSNKRNEGPRVSDITWTMAADDDFSVPEPLVTGTLDVVINGTIHSVLTETRVR
jgi:hypothetical protein